MTVLKTSDIAQCNELIQKLRVPQHDSHKGQNGKVLVIGGSELFHAPLIWAAEISSKIVDMVHVSSPFLENNHLMTSRLKEKFWNGIVVPWNKVSNYIEEDDVVVIGPGMPRETGKEAHDISTKEIVNSLLKSYPSKQWIVDGGALQEVEHSLLNSHMIITPHQGEWERLLRKVPGDSSFVPRDQALITKYSLDHGGLTILLKGPTDIVVQGERVISIEGGNAGMTKGGTGDVLAGLTAALATRADLYEAAVAASLINKLAGDRLFATVGTSFNASDLVSVIPQILR